MKNVESGAPRGAVPQLTIAKHQLRDWIEGHFAEFGERDNLGDFERLLNSQLLAAGLLFDQSPPPDTDPWSIGLGYLNPLKLQRRSAFLVVTTSMGIQCGQDDSAYIYGWSDEGWRRVFQNEQNDYTEKAYKPQLVSDVLISFWNQSNNYVALILGVDTWCSSVWHDVYYRAYRLGGDPLAQPLVAGEEWADVGTEPPIYGSVSANEVLVQYSGLSMLSGFPRPYVRHFRIDEPRPKRIDPLALRPVDFVQEWLQTEWEQIASWSESAERLGMHAWHKKLHKTEVFGNGAMTPTVHCPIKPDLWEVALDFSDPATPIGETPKTAVYFTVRWRPPYKFSMVRISGKHSAACTEEDREADEAPQTLFR